MQAMAVGRKKERPKPSGSSLLTDAENEQLFETMGKDRISLAAAVAQLLVAYPDSPNIWRKANDGVAVLVFHVSFDLYPRLGSEKNSFDWK